MINFFTHNWKKKLIALSMAVVLWGWTQVINRATIEKKYLLQYREFAGNFYTNYDFSKDFDVTVELSGENSLVNQIDKDSIECYVDLSSANPEKEKYKIEVDTKLISRSIIKDIEIKTNPDYVNIDFERFKEKEVPVKLEPKFTYKPGYKMVKFNYHPKKVLIRGPESEVNKIEYVEPKPKEYEKKLEDYDVSTSKRNKISLHVPQVKHVKIVGKPIVGYYIEVGVDPEYHSSARIAMNNDKKTAPEIPKSDENYDSSIDEKTKDDKTTETNDDKKNKDEKSIDKIDDKNIPDNESSTKPNNEDEIKKDKTSAPEIKVDKKEEEKPEDVLNQVEIVNRKNVAIKVENLNHTSLLTVDETRTDLKANVTISGPRKYIQKITGIELYINITNYQFPGKYPMKVESFLYPREENLEEYLKVKISPPKIMVKLKEIR